MFCGVSAIFYCIDGFNTVISDPGRAAWLLIAAALLDGIDGKVARISQGTSRFGVELDSLADVISFGVAPMVLVYTLKPFGDLTWVPCMLFLMCGAIRLARFNVMTHRRVSDLGESRGYDKEDFLGLPIPVAALAVAAYVIFCWDRWEELHMEGPFMGLVVLLSVLMVSTVPYQTLPSLAFRSVRSILKLMIWFGAVMAVVIDPNYKHPLSLTSCIRGTPDYMLSVPAEYRIRSQFIRSINLPSNHNMTHAKRGSIASLNKKDGGL